jgi:hypothetical protein
LATVAGLTCSDSARIRTGGSAAPQTKSPLRMPVSMLAEIEAALDPLT